LQVKIKNDGIYSGYKIVAKVI